MLVFVNMFRMSNAGEGVFNLIGLKEIREFAMTLPEVEEGPPVRAARRIAAFKVAGKSFLGVEIGEATMTINLGQERAKIMTSERPEVYEEIWRNRQIFMGLRVQLSKIPARRVRELIEESWRDTAPNRVIEAYEKQRLP